MKYQKLIILSIIIFISYGKNCAQQNDSLTKGISKYIIEVDSIIKCCQERLLGFESDGIIGRKKRKVLGVKIPVSFKTGGFGESSYYLDDSMKVILLSYEVGRLYNHVWKKSETWQIKIYYKDNSVIAYDEIRYKGDDSWFNWKADNYTQIYQITLFFNKKEIVYSKTEGQIRKMNDKQTAILLRINR